MVMLAQSFKPSRVNYPCIVQPKLDGVRCISTVKDGVVTMLTRKDKVIVSMPHIAEELSKLPDGTYDGELFNNGLLFDEISGTVRRQYFDPLVSTKVNYFLYDGYTDDISKHQPYAVRRAALDEVLGNVFEHGARYINLNESRVVNDEEELQASHTEYLSQGYEGSMVRTEILTKKTKTWADPGYEHKRSFALLKLKDFLDDDFEVVGIQEEVDKYGNLKGRTGAFILKTSDDRLFTASGIKDEIKRDSFDDRGAYIGKTAIIKYFELTPDGIPRFPNFVGIRAD